MTQSDIGSPLIDQTHESSMKAQIDVNLVTLGDNELGAVEVTRADNKKIYASWIVKGGKGRGFDDVNCAVPDLTEEQAEAISQAACDIFWGGSALDCPSRTDLNEVSVAVDWDELVACAKASTDLDIWAD